uniref:Uncharacterized protein n=1 Tax=Panagrolaimus sp. ES5 TaxID=591445 RepID=A0AC34GCC9_9BILA
MGSPEVAEVCYAQFYKHVKEGKEQMYGNYPEEWKARVKEDLKKEEEYGKQKLIEMKQNPWCYILSSSNSEDENEVYLKGVVSVFKVEFQKGEVVASIEENNAPETFASFHAFEKKL